MPHSVCRRKLVDHHCLKLTLLNSYLLSATKLLVLLSQIVLQQLLALARAIRRVNHSGSLDRQIRMGKQSRLDHLKRRVGSVLNRLRVDGRGLARRRRGTRHLLLGVLPTPVTNRLVRARTSIPRRFSRIAVLFTSVINFADLSRHLSPVDLITLLGRIFSTFSDLTRRLSLRGVGAVNSTCVITTNLPAPQTSRTRTVTRVTLTVRRIIRSFRTSSNRPLTVHVNVGAKIIITKIVNAGGFVCSL